MPRALVISILTPSVQSFSQWVEFIWFGKLSASESPSLHVQMGKDVNVKSQAPSPGTAGPSSANGSGGCIEEDSVMVDESGSAAPLFLSTPVKSEPSKVCFGFLRVAC